MKRELRKCDLRDVVESTPLLDLPVAFAGNMEELNEWARGHGYSWRERSQELFGGYWRNDANCLLIT